MDAYNSSFTMWAKFVTLMLARHMEVCASSGKWPAILCTWDAVTTCTPVIVFFPLGMWLCLKKQQKDKVNVYTYLSTCSLI